MPIGAFKLNTISAASSVAAESYFILQSTTAYEIGDFDVDSTKNIYTRDYSQNILKINETGTILWQKNITASGVFSSQGGLVVAPGGSTIRYSTYYPISTNVDYPIGWIELSTSTGAQSTYKSFKVSPQNSGYGVNGGTVSDFTTTMDSSGNMYFSFAGVYGGSGPFAWMIKVNNAGTYQWAIAQNFGPILSGYIKQLIDSSGNIYQFDTTKIIKRNSTGTLQFFKSYANATYRAYSGVIDSAGNIYLVFNGGGSSYIVKYDTTFAKVWERKISTGAASPGGSPITIDSSDNLYLITTSGLIYKINSSGTIVATKAITNSAGTLYFNYCKIKNGSLYVGGYVTITENYGCIMKLPTTLSSTGTFGNFTLATGTHSISTTAVTTTPTSPTVGTSNSYTYSANTQTLAYTTPTFAVNKTTIS